MNAIGDRLYSCKVSKEDYSEEKKVIKVMMGYQIVLVVGVVVDYECNQKAWQIRRRHGEDG